MSATPRTWMRAETFFSPVSPLAFAIVCDSVPSGTVPPSTNPSPTRPRRNGQGLFGETWIEGSKRGFGAESCMAQILKTANREIQTRGDRARKVLTNRQHVILLQRVAECG